MYLSHIPKVPHTSSGVCSGRICVIHLFSFIALYTDSFFLDFRNSLGAMDLGALPSVQGGDQKLVVFPSPIETTVEATKCS
jgi:hypothetical protein